MTENNSCKILITVIIKFLKLKNKFVKVLSELKNPIYCTSTKKIFIVLVIISCY